MIPLEQQIVNGLKAGYTARLSAEKDLYLTYRYLIDEGCRKYNIVHDDSFSMYTDAVLAVIHNIAEGSFDGRSSLKTYLFQIFSNKCIDLIRKRTTNKESVHQSAGSPDLLQQLPDAARTAVEKLMDEQKRKLLREQLKQIGEKCRELLLLFEDGLTDKEIALQLAYNTAAVVKTTRLRCLEKLRERVASLLK